MPSVEQVLNGLTEITNSWKILALIWHVYFGAIALALALGIRCKKRTAGMLLALPLFSVSAMAWIAANPFNGIAFAVLGVHLLYFSASLPDEPVRISPPWFFFPGLALLAFGWAYPHFLDTGSLFSYLYLAPSGLIPCPTLSILIGFALVLDGLGSRALCAGLGGAGLLYGVIGVARLGVSLDWELLLGALIILIMGFPYGRQKRKAEREKVLN
jgi:hypothetical protein